MGKSLAGRYVRRKVRKQGDWGRKKKEKEKKKRKQGDWVPTWSNGFFSQDWEDQEKNRKPRKKQLTRCSYSWFMTVYIYNAL